MLVVEAPEGYVTSTQAAHQLGYSPESIRNWLKAGTLEGFRREEDGHYFVSEQALKNFRHKKAPTIEVEEIMARYTDSLSKAIQEGDERLVAAIAAQRDALLKEWQRIAGELTREVQANRKAIEAQREDVTRLLQELVDVARGIGQD